MIPAITSALNPAKIYSTLGNSQSLVPLAVKDIANSCGITAGSYVVGDKLEGKDRFVDEFGTQAIWLFGIPTFKKIVDKTLFKVAKLNPNVDVRVLKDKDVLQKAIEYAPTEKIKQGIQNAADNAKKFKGLTLAKFAISTAATILSYQALTNFRHKQTEKQIEKEFLAKQELKKAKKPSKIQYINTKAQISPSFQAVTGKSKSSKTSFTGGMKDFIFDPVKNLMIVDGAITGERLGKARDPQDFAGYAVKEGLFWGFMYFAGDKIQSHFEKIADKKFGKSIGLDAKVLENGVFKNSFKKGKIEKSIAEFPKELTDAKLYEFLHNNPDNMIVKVAKKSGIISVIKGTNKIDTQKYIDLKAVRKTAEKVENLYGQYKASGETLDIFFKGVKKLKRASVIKNIGSCIAALGVVTPLLMVGLRYVSGNKEFQAKKDLETKLAKKHNC